MVWCGVMELRLWASSCFVSRSQYGPFYPHSPAGWWLETNQVHFYAYFPLTFLSAGHWRLAAGCVSISGVSTDPTSECVAAGPSPPLSWSRWVKSVQINFMILTPGHNARQHTGTRTLQSLHSSHLRRYFWRGSSCNSYKAHVMWWMGDNEQGEPSREHLWSLFHDPNTFFIWPISCVATFTRWFTKVSQQCCKLNWFNYKV